MHNMPAHLAICPSLPRHGLGSKVGCSTCKRDKRMNDKLTVTVYSSTEKHSENGNNCNTHLSARTN
jgi:hypothetical protein